LAITVGQPFSFRFFFTFLAFLHTISVAYEGA
jgi:hypothetical protein